MRPHASRLRLSPLVAAGLVVLCVGCGRSSPSPPLVGEPITGRERIGWDQQAGSAAALATFQYAMYVDGARSVLAGVTCDPAPGAQAFGCSAPLPPMAAGPRVLELASFVISNGSVLESARSPPLRVVVSAASTAPAAAPAPITTADGVRVVAEVVLDGLTAPVDFARAGDGRLFIAERAGRVLVAEPAGGRLEPALTLENLGARGEGELLSIALHPDFDRTGFVFLVYAAPDGSGARAFEVARFREVGGRLAERAILLDGVPAPSSAASASLRFGPDGRLYVSFDDGGVPASAGSLGAFNGKVLRMTDRGELPDDNPLPSLVYSLDHRSPSGLDWHPASRALWVVDRDAGGRDVVLRVTPGMAAGDRWQVSADLQPGAAGAAFYTGNEAPEWHGDLFVAAADGAHLVRVRFDDGQPAAPLSTERLLAGEYGHIRQVVMGTDGALYFSTTNPYAVGAGGDVLVRLTAAGAR